MRSFITGYDVEVAHSLGSKELRIGPRDVITGVAREVAERLGIRIVVSESDVPARPAPAGRSPGGVPAAGPAPAAQSAAHGRGGAAGRPFVPAYLGGGSAPAASRRGGPAVSADRPPYDLEAWRRRFPILKDHIHVANCSQSPQSDYTREAAQAYLASWDTMGMDWDRWMEEIGLAKAEFARIINADPSEIAIGTSVSELTSTVASSLPFGAGRQKVVLTEAEFPTIGHIWLAHQKFGLKTQFIPVQEGEIDPADYDRYVDEQTLITSVCDVYYYNGFKQDLADIIPRIHAKGSLVYLDAYQGIGTHPIDVKALDVDFLGTGNLKYLLGIPGVAFLYVKKELIPYLQPAFTGWFGQENPFAFQIHNLDFASDARRFDNGTPPVLTAYIARGGMRIINEVGVEAIQYWTDRLSQRCIDGALARGLELASPRDVRKKAPNTAIRVPGNAHDVEVALRKMGIIASARADVIRIAAHFFTRLEDIDYILDCLVKVLGERGRRQG